MRSSESQDRRMMEDAVERIARAVITPRAAATDRAKLFASEAGVRVAERGLQVMNGHGYCRDFSVERCYRDTRGLTLHFKTSELLRSDIARNFLGF